ncbi:MAG: RraA family protein [Bacteroidota bacterium]
MSNDINESDYFKRIQSELYVAAVCDVLDELDYRNQAMHQRLRPLLPDLNSCGFIGRARTFRWMDTNHIAENPYGLEIEAMDSLGKNDVVVHSTDYGGTNAPWGELMSTVAKRNGAVGCVCDSQIRDCTRIIEMGFPVYYTGIRPLDSKGRAMVVSYDDPVSCGGVLVQKGDIIFADFDGIVVIPKEIENQVFDKALDKAHRENLSRKELLEGSTLKEVYNKYKAL